MHIFSKVVLFGIVICIPFLSSAQFYEEKDRKEIKEKNRITFNTEPEINLGFGLGWEYGFLGAKLSYFPENKVGLFASVGSTPVGFGFNVGGIYRIIDSENRFVPYLTAMYGSNIHISVENNSQYDKLYYGPSGGLNVEIHSRKRPRNFWCFGVLVRGFSSEYLDDLDQLKKNPNVDAIDPSPVDVSIGYHINIK